MTPQEKVIAVALGFVGYLEKASRAQLDDLTANAGRGNWTRFGRDYDALMGTHLNGQPWCAMFAGMVFVQAFNFETAKRMIGGNLYASCGAWIAALQRAGQWIGKATPRAGDIVFFADANGDPCHVELVTGCGTYVSTVGGNTSSELGVVPNGGAVAKKSYAKAYSRIIGYGRPKYEIVQEDDDMTGEEIYKKLNEYLAGYSCPEGVQAEFDEAIRLGITDGTSPMGMTPRCVAAIMAKRAAQK